MKATKIKMKPGCANSTKTTEIDQIYIEGCSNPGYYKKADIYDHLKSHPNSISTTYEPTDHANVSKAVACSFASISLFFWNGSNFVGFNVQKVS